MFGRTVCMSIALASTLAVGAAAQNTGGPMRDRMIDAAANSMVQQIQTSSCASFASMLQSRKSGGGGGRRSTGSMIKQNPAARARFVNRVAGPLVNKMIDCDMLPSS
jgi:hypothetical protein